VKYGTDERADEREREREGEREQARSEKERSERVRKINFFSWADKRAVV